MLYLSSSSKARGCYGSFASNFSKKYKHFTTCSMTVSYSLGRQMCVWENFETRPKASMSVSILAVFYGCVCFFLLWESTFKKANQQLILSSTNGQSGLHCFTFLKLFLSYGFYSGHHIQNLSLLLTEGMANKSVNIAFK